MAVSNLNVRIGADTTRLRTDLARANSMFAKFNGTIGGLSSTINAAFGGFAIFQGLSYGIKEIASLEYELDSVRALTGATERQFQQLANNAKELGASTRYTAQEIAKLQQEYGRLGFSTNEILKVTDSTSKLAIATGEDLAEAALIAGTTLRQYNLDASEMGRVNDVIAASLNKSALDLNTFAEAMKYVGPVAHSAGVTLEETAAMLSVLADSGIKGSQAGTSLRRILTDMAATGKPASEALREVANKGIDLTDAMDEVGRYAQTALLVLSNQTVKLDSLTGSYQNANGELQKMATIMEDNLIGDWYKFTSAIDAFIQSGSGAISTMRAILSAGTSLANLLAGGEAWKQSFEGGEESLKRIRDEQKKLEIQTKNIETTIQAAFDSGNVEAYIKALDGNIYKEEIIIGIREIQKKQEQEALNILIAQTQALKEQAEIYAKNIGAKRTDSVVGLRAEAPEVKGFTDGFDAQGTLARMSKGLEEFTPVINKYADAYRNLGVVFTDSTTVMINKGLVLEGMFYDLTNSVATFFGEFAAGITQPGDFAKAFLTPIADAAIKLGGLLIAAGLGVEAFKTSLLTLNGITAVAAGAALVGIGAAIKGMGSDSGGSSRGAGSSGGYGGGYSGAQMNVMVSGEFVMKGDDMVVVLNRANQKRKYTVG